MRPRETIELAFEQPRARTSGPLLTQVKLTWTGRGLLEGRLELVLKSGHERLATCRTPDLALATGEQRFDLLLPAVSADSYDPQLDVYPRFLTRRKAFEFPMLHWMLPAPTERGCVLCVCHDAVTWNALTAATARALHLETFRPKRVGRAVSTVTTANRLTPPDEMPSQPVAYCAFDVVLLVGRGFSLLAARQLDALARWARAGGSVCVVPDGGLEARHAEFLNALAGRPAFRLAADGRLERLGNPAADDGFHTFHCCLGRLAVAARPPAKSEDLQTPAWRRATAFLWKVRRAQLKAVLGPKGVWRTDLQQPEPDGELPLYSRPSAKTPTRMRAASGQGLPLYPLAFASLGQILDGLMPERVRVMPFGVVVLILVLFTACIGPLDYLVLGALGQRKLTWVVFPLTAVVFTWFTVRLAEHYMGLEDHRKAIVFVDLDARGAPVRQSRYEFVFSAAQRADRREVRRGLYYTLGHGSTRDDPWAYHGRYAPRIQGEKEPLLYEGRLPGRYTVAQHFAPWRPCLNRAFFLEAPAREPAFPWAGAQLDATVHASRKALGSRLAGLSPRPSAAYLFHGSERHELFARRPVPVLSNRPEYASSETIGSLLDVACVRPQVGLFSIVSQIAPTGAPDLEDLAILDPTDPTQRLLVVVEHEGDDVYVYRRLYRESD